MSHSDRETSPLWRPTPHLATERLGLEPLRIFHAAEMVKVLADEELYEFTGGEPPSYELVVRRYTMMFAGSREKTEYWHNWILRHRESTKSIGHVQATVEATFVTLAWTIGRRWQRQGFATEASQGVRSWLVANGSPPISAWIHPDHAASQRVAQSVGLKVSDVIDEDGELRWDSGTSSTAK